MDREFEFRQILRAFRAGIISKAAFEEEMARLEGNGSAKPEDGGFRAFGRTYKSERDAVISFLDKVRVGEANGGEAFAAWAAVCKTDCIHTGLHMIAEREAYHARVFEQRLLELGGEKRATVSDEGLKFKAYLGDPNVSDTEKLLTFTKKVGDAKEAVRPIHEFAELLKDDLATKEALKLFAADELSSVTWVWEVCAALNASQQAAAPAPAPEPAEKAAT
jgi:hypothetical protein